MLKVDKDTSTNLNFLDGLRGLAAIYVVIGHARWLLWEGFSFGYANHPENYSKIDKIVMYFFSIFKFGHEAVIFFFILSGFVIHLKYSKSLLVDNQFEFDFKNYFLKRINRIYPPLLLSIIVTFLIDFVGMQLELPIYLGNTNYPNINSNITADHSVSTLIGNLVFLMDGFVPVWGTNGVLWSLFYEWWFYCLYPVFFYFYRKSTFPVLAVIILTSTVCAFRLNNSSFFLTKIFSYFLIWWIGVLLADIYTKRIRIKAQFVIPLIISFAFIPLIQINSNFLHDLFIAMGFAGLLAFLLFLKEDKKKNMSLIERFKSLGDISYTLYIIHLPIIVFISGSIMKAYGYLPSHFGFVIIGVITALLFANLLYKLVEKPFNEKKLLIRVINSSPLKSLYTK